MDILTQSEKTPKVPIVFFGAYCLGGFSLLSYMSYKIFVKAATRIKLNRPKGEKLMLSKMSAFGGLRKGLLVMGLYSIGFTYMILNLDIEGRIF